jgi:hypothetical protein
VADEAPAVERVAAAFERGGAGVEVDGGRDGGHALERGRRPGPVVAGEPQDHVAAHREPGEEDLRQPLAPGQLFEDDAADVLRHPAVVERGGEVLGAAAVAHVHADDVEAAAVSLLRRAEHVERVGRAFEPVQQEQGRRRPALRLPAAFEEDARAGLDLEEARLVERALLPEGAAAREVFGRDDGLRVRAGEERVRHERLRREGARDLTEPRAQSLRRDVCGGFDLRVSQPSVFAGRFHLRRASG